MATRLPAFFPTSLECFQIKSFLEYPFPKRHILDSSSLKEFADDNFEFDEICRKYLKRVESTVEKGEIAGYEQFLLFPQYFQKACTTDT